MNTTTQTDSEETITVNLIDLLQKPLAQLEKEPAMAKTAVPLAAAMAKQVAPPAESAAAGMPEEESVARDRQVYLEANKITQQPAYQKLAGSSTRKLRYLLQTLQASGAPAGAEAEEELMMAPAGLAAGMLRLFNIDEIPALSVWHGKQCEFLVDWVDCPSAAFSVKTEPHPEGEVQLLPSNGTDHSWHFRYTPAANDKFPFTVTLDAVLDKQAVHHSFEITPMPILPLEQSVFGSAEHTQPGPIDFLQPEVTEETIQHTFLQNQAFVFNYARPTLDTPLTLRKVKILGETLVFDKDADDFGLYATYHNARDIEQLELTAQQVIIRSPLNLCQTHVIINAEALCFEGDTAQLKTTPVKKTDKPGISQPGADGLKAGDIRLNIGRFHTAAAAKGMQRLDLTGSNGQAGGNGQDGTDGPSISSYGREMRWIDSGIHFGKTAPAGFEIIYEEAFCTCAMGIPIKAFSRGNPQGWPGDGTPALPSGKPGEGGAGGSLISSQDVAAYATFGGGQAGVAAKQPRGYYRGGAAGWPVNSIKYSAKYCLAAGFKELGRRTTKAGANADILYAKNAYGEKGEYKIGGQPYAWLDPILLNKLLNHIKDDYLANRLDEATARLQACCRMLAAYKADASWQTLANKTRLELEQLHAEMQLLLHRIGNNLDYFGHPAGWVPLLSFEVNRTIFDNEIDSAAEILYYAYCIQNKAASAEKRFESLKSMRAQMEKDIATAVTRYNDVIERIPGLRTTAENLQAQTLETQYQLEAKETELRQQAEENLRPPAWLVGARLGLKISGTIISMIPVYQPAMGAIGGGLNLLSDFDPDKPWDSIIGGADITTQFLKSSYDDSAKDLKSKLDEKKVKEAGGESLANKMKYLDAARQSSAALSTGLSDIQSFIQKNSAPLEGIEAELEKLESQSEEFQALVQKIQDLLKRKADFVAQLAAAMQEVSTLSNFISRSILAMDAMNLDMHQVQAGLDKRTAAYVSDMERRAYDRLLEYHYDMAKAYEYRILKPYTKPLDFEQLIKQLEKLAKVKAWDELDSATFKSTYTAVYKESLAELANDIFRDYNNKPNEKSNRFGYLLSDEELQRLNAGETITVNLAKYLANEDNLRMVNIGIQMQKDSKRKGDIQTRPAGGEYARNAYLDLSFTHPSISKIRSAGNIYQYQHPFVEGDNPLVWKARYEPESDMVTHSLPSAASESLLKSLLKGDALADMMLYSRPSVWADLQIAKSGYPNNGDDINIERLKLELTYDYFKSADNKIDKQILVTAIEANNGGEPEVHEAAFEPYFIVDTADDNARQDARGGFLRVYDKSWDKHIVITAQATYGHYLFNKWTDVNGKDLAGADGTRLTLELKNDLVVCAQYIASEAVTKQVLKAAFAIPHAEEIGHTLSAQTEPA